ncbi:hypothetical protein GYMLUDRAFT_250914 [Collybiopsis luxurians FD-317 M1]|uniref:Uncharacterized protein n=1 Tax=Collybiopsis luxurians FD-317 M1 TaxID=944289 RepID=A0A0D0C4M3_9AGAR|nr:hypothetical protein GYMLUDRAFT_250914 [Collybiopsis luxurians FD-317 M1]
MVSRWIFGFLPVVLLHEAGFNADQDVKTKEESHCPPKHSKHQLRRYSLGLESEVQVEEEEMTIVEAKAEEEEEEWVDMKAVKTNAKHLQWPQNSLAPHHPSHCLFN